MKSRNQLPFWGSLALLALFVLGLMAYQSTFEASRLSSAVNHSLVVISQVRQVQYDIAQMEVNQQGFLLSHDDNLLASYRKGRVELFDSLKRLETQVADHPLQLNRVGRIRDLSERQLEALQIGLGQALSDGRLSVKDAVKPRGQNASATLKRLLDDMETEENRLLEARTVAADATLIWMRMLMVGSFVGALLAALAASRVAWKELARRQVTARALKTARDEAVRARLAESTFLANMSHEIRNPLQTVVGMVDLLLRQPPEPERQRCLQVLKNAAGMLMSLISDVLDLNKAQAGHLTLDHFNFNLADVVSDCVEMVRARAHQKKLSLGYRIENDVYLHRQGDANRLRQVFLNLLVNAIKFTEEGRVYLYVSKGTAAGTVLVAVSDSGLGIPESVRGRIFERFVQGTDNADAVPGTGLGLSISRQIIEQMGGHIWFESKADRGTTFFIEIPLSEGTVPFATPTESSRGLVFQQTLRVLIADDQEEIRLLLQMILRGAAYQLEFASTGLELVEKAKAGTYDVILTDVVFPDISGFDAVSQIRDWEHSHGQSPRPILALTGLAMPEILEQGKAAGLTAVLTKPVQPETLLQTLEQMTHRPDQVAQVGLAQRVCIKRELQPLTARFFENRNTELKTLEDAVADEDFPKVHHLAHGLKGVASSFGFQNLADWAEQIQQAAQNKNRSAILERIEAARTYLSVVQVDYI